MLTRKNIEKVAITDLDVVNPYFRSRDVKHLLDEAGIRLIAPAGKLSTSDLPIVSGEIYGVISNPEYHLIIDVGGDQDGATALGQYYNDLKNTEHEMAFVINANRPQVSTATDVIAAIRRIESVSRLKVTGLINNTHLGVGTTLSDITKGTQLTGEVAEKLKIPFLFTTIDEKFKEITSNIDCKERVLYINRFMRLPWE